MKLFADKKANHGYTVIIGCGSLGASIADALSEQGWKITVIDCDKDSFRRLSPSFNGSTLIGDATDIDILNEAQLDKAASTAIVTGYDNTNIMIARIVREFFKTKRVIAKLNDPERDCVYHEFNIDTICPAVLSAKEVGRLLDSAEKDGIL
jgi:trk system potassium uptake protein TrkA